MNKSLEKQTIKYVICSLDNIGKTIYLHSLHDFKWELTPDIERATKTLDRKIANIVLDNYYHDMKPKDEEWLIVPVVTEYYLVNES